MVEEQTPSVIDELVVSINGLLDDIDAVETGDEKINNLLVLWEEHNRGIKKFNQTIDRIKTMIRVFLKEKNWNRYDDKSGSKMSVVISKQKRESFDKDQLKLILSEAQYAMVLKTTTFEKMQIVTQEARQRMKKMIKK